MNGIGTNYSDHAYGELQGYHATQILSEADAMILINKEFGFEASRVEVHTDAIVAEFYEKEHNGTPVWSPAKIHARKALYAAPDFNYIRFNVCGRQYEMCDGELCSYVD